MAIARYFGLWIGDERILRMSTTLQTILTYRIYVEEMLELWKNPWVDMGESPSEEVCDNPIKFNKFLRLRGEENKNKRQGKSDGKESISLSKLDNKLKKKNG